MDPRQQPFLMPQAPHDPRGDASDRGAGTVDAVPTNEMLLTRRLAQIEKERDGLASELARIKISQRAGAPAETMTIQPDIIPVLDLLRNHIAILTRDNEALRYTFIESSKASSSKTDQEPAHGVDLEEVVSRVKALVQENEELEQIVLEAGRESADDYRLALDDAKAVISSLDSDSAHYVATVNSLRRELDAYRDHFGPLPERNDSQDKPSHNGRITPSQRSRRVSKVPDAGRSGASRESGDKIRGDGRKLRGTKEKKVA